ncbi:hypothetical protein L7F22_063097 [Adiantum nelumboides]|nr:hypothetical protein [Adiantum nelumboides]
MDHELEELHLQSLAVGDSMSRSKRFLMGNNVDATPIEEALASIEKGMPASSTPQFIIDSIANILHRCHKAKNPSYVTRVYACMQERGLDVHRSLGNHLVSLLVDAGSIHSAHQVFAKLPYRSECSWTSLINGYIKHGKPQQALCLYVAMKFVLVAALASLLSSTLLSTEVQATSRLLHPQRSADDGKFTGTGGSPSGQTESTTLMMAVSRADNSIFPLNGQDASGIFPAGHTSTSSSGERSGTTQAAHARRPGASTHDNGHGTLQTGDRPGTSTSQVAASEHPIT